MFRLIASKSAPQTARLCLRRNFSLSAKRNGGHGHHHNPEIAPNDEKLIDNPLYLTAFAGILAGSAILILDDLYKAKNGASFLGRYITPASKEHIEEENVAYDQILEKDKKFYDAVLVIQDKGPFRDMSGSTQVIRRGSPFNSEPGTAMDIDNLAPRRQRKTFLVDSE